jgi:hypothetical protein
MHSILKKLFPVRSWYLQFQVSPTIDHSVHKNFGIIFNWKMVARDVVPWYRFLSHTISHHKPLVSALIEKLTQRQLVTHYQRCNKYLH